MSSPSTPPRAGRRFSTRDTNGIDDLSTLIARLPRRCPRGRRRSGTRRSRRCAPFDGHRAVAAERAVGQADRRPEPDLARRQVEREVRVVGAAGGEVAARRSTRPSPRRRPPRARRSSSPGTTGPRLSRKRWPGTPSEIPISSSVTSSALTASTVPPIVIASRPLMLGEAAVGGLALGQLRHPRPQPAGPLLRDQRHHVAVRDVDHDVAVAVEAAGGVGVELARLPVVAGPRLPGQRRVGRVDADAVDVGA